MAKKRSVFRRAERWTVGVAMGVMAYILEKAVMRSVRKGNVEARPAPEPTMGTIKGSEIQGPLGG
jgi:hypothetical protein